MIRSAGMKLLWIKQYQVECWKKVCWILDHLVAFANLQYGTNTMENKYIPSISSKFISMWCFITIADCWVELAFFLVPTLTVNRIVRMYAIAYFELKQSRVNLQIIVKHTLKRMIVLYAYELNRRHSTQDCNVYVELSWILDPGSNSHVL